MSASQPTRSVRLSHRLPQEPETADAIMLRLGRRTVGDSGRRYVVTRGPGAHDFSVDAGAELDPPAARAAVVAALDQLSPLWREHLIVIEPGQL